MPLLLAIVVGCGDAALPGATAQFDTIGPNRVEVQNTGEPFWRSDAGWRLEPDLQLGTRSGGGPEQFGAVSSVATDSRGRIYVVDSSAQDIRVFDHAGGFSHAIGRKGEGPGEFLFAGAVSVSPGDTLIVRDDGAMRYSIFAPDGELIRVHRRDVVGTIQTIQPASLVDGRYVDWAPDFPDGRFGARFHLRPILYSRTFDRNDSLPPIEHTFEMLQSGMPQTYLSSGIVGTVDSTGRIWFANSGAYRIYRRSLEGDTTLVVDFPTDPVAIGEVERAEVRNSLSHLPSLQTEVLDALPDALPVIRAIGSDNAGHIFVFPQVATAGGENVIDVFRDDGLYLGRMTIPAGLPYGARSEVVMHVRDAHLYLLTLDDLDVPYVTRFRIVKKP